jgi:hypothetical protein
MGASTESLENFIGIRRSLLASVSAIALISGSGVASAEDIDRPTVWIDLGAQFERLRTEQETYLPPFMAPAPSFVTISPAAAQNPPLTSFGGELKIAFQPKESDWIFSAAMRFGRVSAGKHEHQQTLVKGKLIGLDPPKYITGVDRFADAQGLRNGGHVIADFSAGKDVGLGMFGNAGVSVVNAGIRFAQFTEKSSANLGALPSEFRYVYNNFFHVSVPRAYPRVFYAIEHSIRSFSGVGPSLSWNASADILGNELAEVSVDWGANAAILFGRQKVAGHDERRLQTHFLSQTVNGQVVTNYDLTSNFARRKFVSVPNVGGFAGVSLKFPNAKVSLGYRADFFFNVMDVGMDTRKESGQGFFGPFATVSWGVGG